MEKWIAAAPVIMLWPSIDKARSIDKAMTRDVPSSYDWLQHMTTEERRALCFENRVQTQLLYGEEVEVERVEGEWAYVRATSQPYREEMGGYPGWIKTAHFAKKQGDVQVIGYVRVKEARTVLLNKSLSEVLFVLSLNTVLPVVAKSHSFYEVVTPHGIGCIYQSAVEFSTQTQFIKRDAQAIAKEMLKFVDTPYIWGGMSSYGYDCSGLAYNAMKACGYHIPRDAKDQAKQGESINIAERDAWRAGDLIFFTTPPAEQVTHVGIYLGNDLLLHSTIYKDRVEVIKLLGHSLNNEISFIQRYINEEGN